MQPKKTPKTLYFELFKNQGHPLLYPIIISNFAIGKTEPSMFGSIQKELDIIVC